MRTITYEPECGSHISLACSEAKALAKRERRPVRFTFNGIEVLATRKRSITSMLRGWEIRCRQIVARRRRSPAGKCEARRRAAEIVTRQMAVNASIGRFIDYDGNLASLMIDLRVFTEAADDREVVFPRASVAKILIRHGFKENENVDLPPEAYTTRETVGRYIVGQAISCLLRGMSPHPVCSRFIDDYFKLPAA